MHGEQAARDELAPLAEKQIPLVFGYDYQTVERSLNEVYPLLTPSYRQEFEDRALKDIIPQARERQLVSQAHVVGVGVMTAQRNSASVMVYMNRTVTDKSKEPDLRRQPPTRRLPEDRRQVVDPVHHSDLVEANASRNDCAHRSTSCTSTWRRSALIRRLPSSGV